jgi:hypothetical protein
MLREAVGENQYQNNLAGKGHSPYERTRPVVLIGFAIAKSSVRRHRPLGQTGNYGSSQILYQLWLNIKDTQLRYFHEITLQSSECHSYKKIGTFVFLEYAGCTRNYERSKEIVYFKDYLRILFLL